MTNWERSSGVRRPFRGGVISKDEPCSLEDCGVPARGLGVCFRGGDCLVLGKRDNPPEGPFDAIAATDVSLLLSSKRLFINACWFSS